MRTKVKTIIRPQQLPSADLVPFGNLKATDWFVSDGILYLKTGNSGFNLLDTTGDPWFRPSILKLVRQVKRIIVKESCRS